MKDLTFVIQGKAHPNSISNIENYLKYGKVIFSVYENDNPFLIQEIQFLCDKYEDVSLILNETPDFNFIQAYNRQNIYLQGYTTLNGLRQVNTEYAIKTRSDERFEDFSEFIKAIKEFPDKYTTINFIFRKDSAIKFHPSDHLMGSKTTLLINTFEILLSDMVQHVNTPSEVKIFVSFLKAKGIDPNIQDSKNITKNNSQIVNLRTFKKFVLKNNGANDYKNPLTRTEKDIINIETTDPDSILKMEDL
jgi:hypothetical protein